MRVVSIRPAGVEDVYNMEVAETHDFAVGSGIIAHNCYDECRYVCMANPIAPRERVEKPRKAYSPLETDKPDYDRYEFYRKY